MKSTEIPELAGDLPSEAQVIALVEVEPGVKRLRLATLPAGGSAPLAKIRFGITNFGLGEGGVPIFINWLSTFPQVDCPGFNFTARLTATPTAGGFPQSADALWNPDIQPGSDWEAYLDSIVLTLGVEYSFTMQILDDAGNPVSEVSDPVVRTAVSLVP